MFSIIINKWSTGSHFFITLLATWCLLLCLFLPLPSVAKIKVKFLWRKLVFDIWESFILGVLLLSTRAIKMFACISSVQLNSQVTKVFSSRNYGYIIFCCQQHMAQCYDNLNAMQFTCLFVISFACYQALMSITICQHTYLSMYKLYKMQQWNTTAKLTLSTWKEIIKSFPAAKTVLLKLLSWKIVKH